MWIGRNRKARVTYGFDEIALVPGRVTINPKEVDITFGLARKNAEPLKLKIPIFASAMDGVVDVHFAIGMSKLGGLAVLNLEGVQTRYKNPQEVLQKIVETDKAEITGLLQKIYQEPDTHWDAYELAEKLVDLDEAYALWRYRHLKVVSRIIGQKRGTGGTAGVGYLEQIAGRVFFPELWDVRTELEESGGSP